MGRHGRPFVMANTAALPSISSDAEVSTSCRSLPADGCVAAKACRGRVSANAGITPVSWAGGVDKAPAASAVG